MNTKWFLITLNYYYFQTKYTKNLGIRGFPGSGKTWCMMYSMVYAISKGLTVCTTAMMCKRALQLGGIHIDQLFKLPYGSGRVDAHRRAELAIIKLLGNPKKLDFMRSVDILFLMRWVRYLH